MDFAYTCHAQWERNDGDDDVDIVLFIFIFLSILMIFIFTFTIFILSVFTLIIFLINTFLKKKIKKLDLRLYEGILPYGHKFPFTHYMNINRTGKYTVNASYIIDSNRKKNVKLLSFNAAIKPIKMF